MKFWIKFAGMFAVFLGILILSEKLFIDLFTLLAKGFLLLFKESAVNQNQLFVNGQYLLIVKECTGIQMYAIFAAFALAYKPNVKYLVLGLALLFGLNVIRMYSLILTAAYFPNALIPMHEIFWPSTYFMFTLGAAYFYIKKVKVKK